MGYFPTLCLVFLVQLQIMTLNSRKTETSHRPLNERQMSADRLMIDMRLVLQCNGKRIERFKGRAGPKDEEEGT